MKIDCVPHYIFSLSSNVMFGLRSFIGQVIGDNSLQVALDTARTISHSLNAAVVLQQLYWLILADLDGVDWWEVLPFERLDLLCANPENKV